MATMPVKAAGRGGKMSSLDPIPYSDAQIRAILERVRTIAMVGASSNWNRPSYFVMKWSGGPRSSPVIPEEVNFSGVCGERVTLPYVSMPGYPAPFGSNTVAKKRFAAAEPT